MNDHPTAQSLQQYVLGTLPEERLRPVIDHLETCKNCTSQVEAIRAQQTKPSSLEAVIYPSNPSLQTSVSGSSSGTSEPSSKTIDSAKGPIAKPLELPPELVDHAQYKVIKKIGRGGMGVLYLVEHRVTTRQEALKIIHPHLINNPGVKDRFLREIQTAAKLNHPNVVRTLSALSEGNLLGLVMEYAPGETLQRLVTRIGPLAVDRVLDFMVQAAEGLAHAESQGMVHRDIKPANLMITKELDRLRLRILDFGLARSTFDTEEQRQMTQTDSILGTPEYIAPEQALHPSKADIRADIYSLGCCMYFALTGTPPCTGETTLAILHAHLNGDVTPLLEVRPDLPKPIAQLQQLMMQKSVEKRFQSPNDLLFAIRKVQKHLAESLAAKSAKLAPPPKPTPKPTPTPTPTLTPTPTPTPTLTAESSKSDLFNALASTPSAKGKAPQGSKETVIKKPTVPVGSMKINRSLWITTIPFAGKRVGLPIAMGATSIVLILVAIFVSSFMWMDSSSPDDATILITDLPNDIEVFLNGKKKVFRRQKEGEAFSARTSPGVTVISFQRAGKEINKQQVRLAKQQRATIKPNLAENDAVLPSLNQTSPETPSDVADPNKT